MGLKRMLAGVLLSCVVGTAAAIPAAASAASGSTAFGDVNCDGEVNMADAVLVMQSIANPDKYILTAQGEDNADVANRGDGVTNTDALTIQRYKLGLVDKLPVSYKENHDITTETVTTTSTATTTTVTTIVTTPPVTETCYIHLNGSSISVEGSHATANGSKAVIDHSGIFVIDGTLSDGQIEVNIADENADPETVKLLLNGVNITGRSAPALLIKNAEKTSVTAMDGTENTFSDTENAYTGDDAENAVIEAKDDITFKGGDEGTGIITINANVQPAVSCNNDIKITGGNIRINAANKTDGNCAIKGKTSVTVKNGKLEIIAEGDGLKSSKGNVDIEGGEIVIRSSKDAIQAKTSIAVSGGDISVFGDRGLTCEGTIDITGGTLVATAYDNQCEGTLNVSQPTMMLDFTKEWSKNNPITVTAPSNNVIIERNPLRKYKYAVISSPEMDSSTEYKVFAGGIKMKHSTGITFRGGSPAAYQEVNNDMDNEEQLYSSLFDQTAIHSVDIRMSDREWNELLSTAKEEEWHNCDVVIDGEELKNVGIRAKGNSSLIMVQNGKYSFRFKLDKYDKYTNYHGLTEFCINNMYSDNSCLRDILCYNAMYAIDGVAPLSAHSDVYVNGSLYSFYMIAEQPGKTLAERYSIDDDSNLYKATERSEQGGGIFGGDGDSYSTFTEKMPVSNLDLKFGNDKQLQHLEELKAAINRVTASDYKFIEEIMDVPSFLKGFAVNSVMCNYDSYNGSLAHNYYLLYTGGKHYFVGWDYNLCLGNFTDGANAVNSDVKTSLYQAKVDQRPFAKLLQIPEYYEMYIGYVNEIMSLYSDPERYVADYADRIRSHVQSDPLAGFTLDDFNKSTSRSAEGLQFGNGNGNGNGFGFGFGFGFGGGGGGGGFFGGGNISVVDFLIKRFEVISSSIQ
ncbi:MAG: carbohydrate-binding domain-containing protein [Ruminococcus sp.]|nr:carbohydrate-binding domain-containing protein [Ruminococcus sp.]